MYIALRFNQSNNNLDLFSSEIEKDKDNYIAFKEYIPSKLKELNDKWFNIYQTLNEFRGDRRILSEIDKYKHILIDFDKKGEEDYRKLLDKLKMILKASGYYPTMIIETYKGYHLLFKLDKKLEYLNQEQYEKFAKDLVIFLGWDIAAHQTDGMFKMPWFLDRKNWRDFLIREVENTNWKYPIKIEHIKKFLWEEKIKFRRKKKTKEITTKQIEKFIMELNSLSFKNIIIPKLREYWVDIEINPDNTINNHNGLKYCPNGDYVNDFSHGKQTGENRGNWNYNFLYRYIFKEDFKSFISFCANSLGIKTIWDKNITIPKRLFKALAQKDLKVNWKIINTSVFSSIQEYIGEKNNLLLWFEKMTSNEVERYKNSIVNTYLSIYGYIKNNLDKWVTMSGENKYSLEINDFLEFIWLETSYKNRQKLLKTLIDCNYLSITKKTTKIINWKEIEGVSITEFPLKLTFLWKDKVGRTIIELQILETQMDGNMYIPSWILNLNKKMLDNKNNKTILTLELMDLLEQVGNNVLTISVDGLAKRMGLQTDNDKKVLEKIREYLKDLVNIKVIKNFVIVKKVDNAIKINWEAKKVKWLIKIMGKKWKEEQKET